MINWQHSYHDVDESDWHGFVNGVERYRVFRGSSSYYGSDDPLDYTEIPLPSGEYWENEAAFEEAQIALCDAHHFNLMNQEPQQIASPNKMPRGSAILYPKEGLETGVLPHFAGMTVMPGGVRYWIEAWIREVNTKTVLELKMTSK